MARKIEEKIEDVALEGMPESTATTATQERRVVDKAYRPLFLEVGRLSGILGLARNACYDGAPDKALKALTILESQVSAAREIAELMVPTPQPQS